MNPSADQLAENQVDIAHGIRALEPLEGGFALRKARIDDGDCVRRYVSFGRLRLQRFSMARASICTTSFGQDIGTVGDGLGIGARILYGLVKCYDGIVVFMQFG